MESLSARGKLRAYLGIAPGVGKPARCRGTDAPSDGPTAGALRACPALGPQKFCAVLRGKCPGSRDERRSGGLVKLWGRLGPGCHAIAHSEKEVLLPGR